MLLFAALEWTNPATLGGLDGIAERLWASWFQGVTTRTAEFNTVDIGSLHIMLTHDGDFLDAAFEVTSAFGTVGLSRGTTGTLDELGRAVIIAVMFIGRVGPLTLGFFLATRAKVRVGYPASKVFLG